VRQAFALFVIGGMLIGWIGVQNLASLSRRASHQAPAVAVAAPANSVPTPRTLASHPPLRDFDHHPPPFAAAGQADPAPTPQPSSPVGRLTVLLLGIDQRPDEAAAGGDPGRTDSMTLVSVDFDVHVASMVSIPRDGFVVIPDHGNERVNAAYTFGELDQRGSGPDLAKKTVSHLFGLPVDRYALVDIHSMELVIDTLGGVWIDNPYRLVDRDYPTDDYRTITIDIPAGRQRMDGVTAVEYARTRHPDSDYGRQSRQQQVLLAIRDQVLQLQTLPRLPGLMPELLSLVRTDLSPNEILQLANFGRVLDRSTGFAVLPANPDLTPSYTGPGGAAYINLTPAYRAAVKRLIEQPRVAVERADIAGYNAGAPAGSGSIAAATLGRAGFHVSTIATGRRVAATRIEAGSSARQTAMLVARTLELPVDALVISCDSSSVSIWLGPDMRLPRG
jgi:LCP family protein required for cell wall assembly